ncbi:ABC transporter ATP-binding protein [Castellaniella sp.]|uniref:ABC transporter ATP-binding protein n=1 Tax=Castellaniella sp. TaxID=1955812 RepID=UPI00356A529A
MSVLLRISDLATSYGRIEVLRAVSLQAEKGKITCLLGPNGAGKTTLMMTVAGVLKPQSGHIHFLDRDIAGTSPSTIVRSGIALVPENRLVFKDMSVLDNLNAGAITRKDHEQIHKDRERLLDRFPRLRERSSQLAGTLSGGEQQMLAIARALMSNPRLLLMDEPSVGLAPLVVQEIFTIISELKQDGVSIFLVEQNVRMSLKIADHFYLMDHGRIVFDGAPDEFAEDEVISRAYLGERR